MTVGPSAYDSALVIARELERRGVPYAIGGALAYGIWSDPRNTNDIDLNVFVGDDRLGEAFPLGRAGRDVPADLRPARSAHPGRAGRSLTPTSHRR